MAIISAVGLGNISPLALQRDISLSTAFSRSNKNSRRIATKEMPRCSGFSSSSTAEQVTQGIDASGLTAIVTGASSGIGSETARVLALRGVHVVMGIRNLDSGRKVKEMIVEENPSAKVDAMELDLSSLASVRKFASEFTSSGRPLNLLINNAGIMTPPFELSKDNIELQFATNYLGHFLLADLLLDTMKKTARETKREGRIVNVSSVAHRFPYIEGIRFDKLNDQQAYNRWGAYAQSKLAIVLHANELARRLKEDGAEITANSLHPGIISTNLFRHFGVFEGKRCLEIAKHNPPVQRYPYLNIFPSLDASLISALRQLAFKNVQQGASTSCYVALHPELKGVSGEYFSDNNLAKASTKAADRELARKLWEFSLDLINK